MGKGKGGRGMRAKKKPKVLWKTHPLKFHFDFIIQNCITGPALAGTWLEKEALSVGKVWSKQLLGFAQGQSSRDFWES